MKTVVIFGGDQFLHRLIPIIKLYFLILIFGNGKEKFQPVYIDDVVRSVEKIISSKLAGINIFELY